MCTHQHLDVAAAIDGFFAFISGARGAFLAWKRLIRDGEATEDSRGRHMRRGIFEGKELRSRADPRIVV
jgi:hypothetical protein